MLDLRRCVFVVLAGLPAVGAACGGGDGAVDALPMVDAARLIDAGAVDARAADAAIDALACIDPGFEPNDTETDPTPRPSIDDCDSSEATTDGAVAGGSDLDWIHYFVQDTTSCTVDPTVALDVAGLRMCVFLECGTGTVSSGCPGGSEAEASPDGLPGCCTDALGLVIDLECSESDDSVDVFVRIDDPAGQTCVPYTLTYHG